MRRVGDNPSSLCYNDPMIHRKTFSRRDACLCGTALATTVALSPFGMPRAAAATVGDNGLHVQDWFLQSFLNFAEDQQAASAAQKNFAVLIEQRGCPYCRELHRVNFAKDDIRAYITAHYDVVQLDMWGSRMVTDFDGTEMEERELVRRWRVNFTPTMVFFPRDPALVRGKSGVEAEVARMPGYFKPFHFLSMLEYVHQGAYDEQPFQRFLQDKFKRLEAEGKSPEVW